MEPGAVFGNAPALRGGCVPLAGRGLVAPLGRAPAQLDAVVEIIGHLQRALPRDDVLQTENRTQQDGSVRSGPIKRKDNSGIKIRTNAYK